MTRNKVKVPPASFNQQGCREHTLIDQTNPQEWIGTESDRNSFDSLNPPTKLHFLFECKALGLLRTDGWCDFYKKGPKPLVWYLTCAISKPKVQVDNMCKVTVSSYVKEALTMKAASIVFVSLFVMATFTIAIARLIEVKRWVEGENEILFV
jgi:hypothetical protein